MTVLSLTWGSPYWYIFILRPPPPVTREETEWWTLCFIVSNIKTWITSHLVWILHATNVSRSPYLIPDWIHGNGLHVHVMTWNNLTFKAFILYSIFVWSLTILFVSSVNMFSIMIILMSEVWKRDTWNWGVRWVWLRWVSILNSSVN